MSFNHDFHDFFDKDHHQCLPDAREYLSGALAVRTEPEPVPVDDSVIIEGVLRTFESQVGAFLRGFLTGHSNTATPDELIEAVTGSMCPRCLSYWIERREECCLGHSVIHFMEAVMQDEVILVGTSDVSHGDPRLN